MEPGRSDQDLGKLLPDAAGSHYLDDTYHEKAQGIHPALL